MAIEVIDYSEVYFDLMHGVPVPPQRGGKFILIENVADRYAAFAPAELSAYHANIVERFLWGRGIAGSYNPKGDVFRFDCPDWQMLGGGHWQLDETQAVLHLFGSSLAYGSADLAALAGELRRAGAFHGARVLVG